jgi:hypothetical protein
MITKKAVYRILDIYERLSTEHLTALGLSELVAGMIQDRMECKPPKPDSVGLHPIARFINKAAPDGCFILHVV